MKKTRYPQATNFIYVINETAKLPPKYGYPFSYINAIYFETVFESKTKNQMNGKMNEDFRSALLYIEKAYIL